ncbi:MAG TPA: Swt1 family HEPN domain-containing protein [Candidatus Saccharimonadales bacterium]|jgi:hypothetical protein|nr:Swt1 family HEPN domain-containing protein [Candidatus Saccharimonadales bacterium]
MIEDSKLALFLMLGQTATKSVAKLPEVADSRPLMLSESYDLSAATPEIVRQATATSDAYRLFFVFENYLREMIVRVLSKDGTEAWWDKIPPDVQKEILDNAETEEMKGWMALGSRDKSSLMTYPQMLRVIDENWKTHFVDLLRDKALIQESRHITHLRNTVCHMSSIPEEEVERVKQVMRDWFRIVSP